MTKIPLYKKKGDKPMTIGIYLSGSGTNFIALAEYLNKNRIEDSVISFVYSNVPDCPGIKKAREYGFKTFSISSKDFFADLNLPADDEEGRILYDREVLNLLSGLENTDIIVLAGYRRKLSTLFYENYQNRIINMYPGDITKDYLVTGVSASLQALRMGDKNIKCTVYADSENVRFGKAIVQSKPIKLKGYSEDNISLLDSEIREKAEWTTLPYTVFEIIAKERLSFDERGNLFLDDNLIPDNGIQL